jgi:hypothetical protein
MTHLEFMEIAEITIYLSILIAVVIYKIKQDDK